MHTKVQFTQVSLTSVILCDRFFEEHSLEVIARLSEYLSSLLTLPIGVIKTLIGLRPSFRHLIEGIHRGELGL
jgi:hypothetical protein